VKERILRMSKHVDSNERLKIISAINKIVEEYQGYGNGGWVKAGAILNINFSHLRNIVNGDVPLTVQMADKLKSLLNI